MNNNNLIKSFTIQAINEVTDPPFHFNENIDKQYKGVVLNNLAYCSNEINGDAPNTPFKINDKVVKINDKQNVVYSVEGIEHNREHGKLTIILKDPKTKSMIRVEDDQVKLAYPLITRDVNSSVSVEDDYFFNKVVYDGYKESKPFESLEERFDKFILCCQNYKGGSKNNDIDKMIQQLRAEIKQKEEYIKEMLEDTYFVGYSIPTKYFTSDSKQNLTNFGEILLATNALMKKIKEQQINLERI
jgi:hypothetical protein